jgi:hypothetical protein
MAYTLTYKVQFTNEQSQDVLAEIYRKDGDVPAQVAVYPCVSLELSDKSEGQTKYESTIIARELILTLWTEDGAEITWETFIASEHDEWLIVVTIDGQKYFDGFITPDEGNSPFQDKPYEVTFRATNGLALLKDIPLVDVDGNNFTGTHRLIDYVAAALKQTGLGLDIRVFCNYYNADYPLRRLDHSRDMFNQTYLEYRTFLKDPTTYVSCYDALMIILDKFCRLEYWLGYWLIKNIAELQYLPGKNYYSVYSQYGVFLNSDEDTSSYYQIGKAVDLYPINEDQQIYSRFAIKTAKTQYNYEIWPEIPKNNKFERGTVFETGDATDDEDIDNDGDTSEIIGTYKKYTIPDWEYGKVDVFDLPHPAMTTIPETFYRRSIYNTYGVEINREIIGETDPTDDLNHAFWLRSEGIPVVKGGKIRFSLDKRFDNNFASGGGTTIPVVLYMVVGSDAYYLNNNHGGTGTNEAYWRKAVNLGGQLLIDYPSGSDSTEYASLSITSDPIPFDGTFYIALNVNGPIANTGANQYYKNISFEYIPFVADGYIQVKGDYWTRSQNKTFPDVANEVVRISDSPQKVFKGALLDGNGNLTTPSWFRYGQFGVLQENPLAELRHFKELLNIARYNHSYRRMYALEGSFNGLNCAAENEPLNKFPIRFDKLYRLVDLTEQRDFVLVPPLKMDLIKGWITASLVEVKKVADFDTDGTQTGDSESFNYLFE